MAGLFRLELTFSMVMDRVPSGTRCSLSPALAFGENWNGNTLVLGRREPMAPSTVYHVNLAHTARAVNGASLASSASWSKAMSRLVGSVRTPPRARRPMRRW